MRSVLRRYRFVLKRNRSALDGMSFALGCNSLGAKWNRFWPFLFHFVQFLISSRAKENRSALFLIRSGAFLIRCSVKCIRFRPFLISFRLNWNHFALDRFHSWAKENHFGTKENRPVAF